MSSDSLPTDSASTNLYEQNRATPPQFKSRGCGSPASCPSLSIATSISVRTILLTIPISIALCQILLAQDMGSPPKNTTTSPQYTASAYFRVAYQPEFLVYSSGERPSEYAYENFKNTQIQLVKNRYVLATALRKPDQNPISRLTIIKNQEDPLGWLIRNLSVSFMGKSEIMEITLTANDPKEAADIVTAVMDAYLSEVVDYEKDQRRKRLSDLDRLYTDKDLEVRNKHNELKQLAEQLGTNETETPTLKQKLTFEELATHRQELARSQNEMWRLQCNLALLQVELDCVKSDQISDIECEMYAPSDPLLKLLIQEIMKRKMDSENKNPAELDRFEKEYSQRLEQIRNEIRRKQIGELEKEIKKAEAAIQIANKQQHSNEKDVDRLKKIVEQCDSLPVDVEMLRADIAIREISLDAIAAERDKLKVELHAPSRITPLQKKAEAVKTSP